MRISFYTLRFNPQTGGGSHHQLEIYIKALKMAGHTPVLTTFASSDNDFREAPCEMREEKFTGGFLALQSRVEELMRNEADADAFVAFGPTLMWGAGMYAASTDSTPVIACLNNYTPGMGHHQAPPHAGRFFARVLDRARHLIHRMKWYVWERAIGIRRVRRIRRALFDSPVVLKEYEKFGYRFRDTAILPGSVEKDAATENLHSPFPDDPSLFHVLFVARLIKEKGPDTLVKAAMQLPSSIHMHLIGSGPEEPILRTFISKHGLEKRVHLHGWKERKELPAFYKNADIFIHPCRWPEPFGLVVAQALGKGLPVIATEHTGAAWAAGDAGITFKKDDVAELRKHILFFYNDPRARAEYSRKAIARSRIFDSELIGKQFVENIESITAKNLA